MDRVLGLRNDVGLLSEQYDPRAGRMPGNFPQALSHLALVDAAAEITSVRGPSRRRAEGGTPSPEVSDGKGRQEQ
ncbi:hypothetical protein IMZ11_18100 [Microtetraspora sp. AC03309]|uniref:glycoside hydrolase family 15 protein n=1 Tax=Microtetraspora sp. AC03309 TaxID=2779376 RepID=UPI001E486971|nr:glycoside hydrolase family 15 protein [Microtetraspora sp. AC03309]MCC5577540.1 hypothetical protein [Microtetraspora sp. AC03309]